MHRPSSRIARNGLHRNPVRCRRPGLLVDRREGSAGGRRARVFDQFVKAQNSHDVAAVRELLLDSPNFLWVTRGAPIWGRDAALKRFETLYQGTWKLRPTSRT